MEIDDQTSEFEKCFVEELNAKLFPTSIDQVRKQSHDACQMILQQTRLFSPSSSVPFVPLDEEQLPSKLIVYENVYLLPEEVSRACRLIEIRKGMSFWQGSFPTTRSGLFTSARWIQWCEIHRRHWTSSTTSVDSLLRKPLDSIDHSRFSIADQVRGLLPVSQCRLDRQIWSEIRLWLQ